MEPRRNIQEHRVELQVSGTPLKEDLIGGPGLMGTIAEFGFAGHGLRIHLPVLVDFIWVSNPPTRLTPTVHSVAVQKLLAAVCSSRSVKMNPMLSSFPISRLTRSTPKRAFWPESGSVSMTLLPGARSLATNVPMAQRSILPVSLTPYSGSIIRRVKSRFKGV